jgi:hypothetical protein
VLQETTVDSKTIEAAIAQVPPMTHCHHVARLAGRVSPPLRPREMGGAARERAARPGRRLSARLPPDRRRSSCCRRRSSRRRRGASCTTRSRRRSTRRSTRRTGCATSRPRSRRCRTKCRSARRPSTSPRCAAC